jgi:hypothetical protein
MDDEDLVKNTVGVGKETFKKCVLYAFVTFLLFVLSEILFSYYGNSPQLFLKLSGECLRSGQYSCASFFLNKAADARFLYYKKMYPDVFNIKIDYYVGENVLEKYKIDQVYFSDASLTLIYYFIGLDAYNLGDADLAATVWDKVTYLNPDLSYLYVELSNLYLKAGKGDLAKKTLERCSEFIFPKKHCQDFMNTNIANGMYIDPGFLKDQIVNTSHNY